MGCNTSQELKTKDGNAGDANGEGELIAIAATSNGDVGVNAGEQNGNLVEQQKAAGGGGGGGGVDVKQTRLTASAASAASAVSASSAVSAVSAASAASAATATSNNLTNHSKSNSIISNGDANKRSSRDEGDGGILEKALATVKQQCDKAEIVEFNDMGELGEIGEMGEDEDIEVTYRIPPGHHHHGSKKIQRNPLRNLDLDFKFDVNSF
ncbi:homeotic protein ocelliless-like [Anastrepha obliqua]|uniref:homeotic protein ocelliless-like n=1 Tax=Anastrepha obliqua TaxID=95512 RepID=UPI002409526B|nr:homeotic protein ocelliless-like [Anastrepha obliqua]